MFHTKKIQNKTVYFSDKLDVEHFFTSRELIVKENKDLISDYLKIEKDNLICPNQTHSDNVELVKENVKEYPSCDGLILNKKNIAIYLNFADCTPLIFYDWKNNIGAVSHAGWRGTAQKIGPKTILKMKDLFNTDPKNVIALIGPCISFDKFETSFEVIDELSKTVSDKNNLFNLETSHADLKGINKRQLEELGVVEIDVCPFCTVLDNDKFFSYRKENKTKNRHSALIKL